MFLKWMQIHNCIDLIMYERIVGRTVGKREKEKRNSTAERQGTDEWVGGGVTDEQQQSTSEIRLSSGT